MSHMRAQLTYQRSNVGEFFIGGNQDGLNKELVAALRIWRWVLFHGLEKDCVQVSFLQRFCEICACGVSYSELRHLCQAQCARCSASHSIYVVIISWLTWSRGLG
jgi:lipoate-protein ligase B